jgi:hypothetical protein
LRSDLLSICRLSSGAKGGFLLRLCCICGSRLAIQKNSVFGARKVRKRIENLPKISRNFAMQKNLRFGTSQNRFWLVPNLLFFCMAKREGEKEGKRGKQERVSCTKRTKNLYSEVRG